MEIDAGDWRLCWAFWAAPFRKNDPAKVIAGLESRDAGTIHLGGREVTGLSPQERGIVYLYHEALLFPHLDVDDPETGVARELAF